MNDATLRNYDIALEYETMVRQCEMLRRRHAALGVPAAAAIMAERVEHLCGMAGEQYAYAARRASTGPVDCS